MSPSRYFHVSVLCFIGMMTLDIVLFKIQVLQPSTLYPIEKLAGCSVSIINMKQENLSEVWLV